MHLLPVEKIEEFVKRFSEFGDGIIREIRIVYYRNGQPTTVDLTLTVMDWQRSRDDAWVDLHLRVCGVSTFSVNEGRETYQVIFDGGLTANGEELTINLDETAESSPEGVLSSKFFVTGSRIEWELADATES